MTAQTPASSPSPPVWQQQLDTIRLLEGTLSITPAKDPAETAARDQRLTQLYRALGDENPDRAAVQRACGDYARRQERPVEAVAFLRRAQALEPGDADTAELLGSVELQLGRTREASEQFQRAVNACPDNAFYHYTLANVLFLFRHDVIDPPALPDAEAVLDESLTEFRRAAELAPGSLQYAQSYAETFYMLSRPDWVQARTAWKAVLALSVPNTDFANAHLARVSLHLKQPEEAEGYLALIQDPKFALLKAKLRSQAAKLPPAAGPSPR